MVSILFIKHLKLSKINKKKSKKKREKFFIIKSLNNCEEKIDLQLSECIFNNL